MTGGEGNISTEWGLSIDETTDLRLWIRASLYFYNMKLLKTNEILSLISDGALRINLRSLVSAINSDLDSEVTELVQKKLAEAKLVSSKDFDKALSNKADKSAIVQLPKGFSGKITDGDGWSITVKDGVITEFKDK